MKTIKCGPRRYDHDCESCEYLGQYEEFDLYFCSSTSSNEGLKAYDDTIVCRKSSEPGDYCSGLSAHLWFPYEDPTVETDAYQVALDEILFRHPNLGLSESLTRAIEGMAAFRKQKPLYRTT